MSTIRHSILVDLTGNFNSKARNLTRSMSSMSKRGRRHLRALKGAADLAGRSLDRMGNRYVGLATGAAGAGAVRYLVSLETRLTQLGVQSNQSAEKMDALKKKIFEVARAPDIRVDPGEITSAIEKIVEKTGDLDLAQDNIRNIGLAIRAAGAAGQDVGATIADANEKFGITSAAEFSEILDIAINQGKLGAFTLNNLTTQIERVTAASGQLNRVGVGGFKEMGAMLQMIMSGVGSPEQAATAFEALIRTLNDLDKRKVLQGRGIQIIDPDDPKRLRSVIEIVKDVIKATDGDAAKISSIFDAEAMRAFNSAIIEYNQTGGFKSFDEFLNVSSDGTQLLADSARNAGTAGAALTSLMSGLKVIADDKLSGPIRSMADALNSLDAKEIDSIMNKMVWAAGSLGGLIVASKAIRGIGAVRSLFGGRRGGGMASAMAGAAQPVMVVNWPMSMGGKRGGIGGGAGMGGGKGFLKMAGRGGRMLGRLAGVAAVPLMALSYGSDYMDANAAGDKVGKRGAVGGFAGGLAGAGTGALIGSVVPIVGTAIGALIGGILGSLAGEDTGRNIAEGEAARAEVKVSFDNFPQGASITDVRSDKGVDLALDIDSGMIMP